MSLDIAEHLDLSLKFLDLALASADLNSTKSAAPGEPLLAQLNLIRSLMASARTVAVTDGQGIAGPFLIAKSRAVS